MIAVVNFGSGNMGSIFNMLKRLGAKAIISSDANDIAGARKIILPGVGSFDQAIKSLQDLDLIGVLNEKVLRFKTPIMGICLGMQLLTKNSEEGSLPGLGWIDAEVVKFRLENEGKNLKIPHMGWNTVKMSKDSYLFKDMPGEPRFYFAHSYHVVCKRKSNVIARTAYGCDFVSAVQQDNIMGVQFHPEKSHRFGLRLLKNFVEYQC